MYKCRKYHSIVTTNQTNIQSSIAQSSGTYMQVLRQASLQFSSYKSQLQVQCCFVTRKSGKWVTEIASPAAPHVSVTSAPSAPSPGAHLTSLHHRHMGHAARRLAHLFLYRSSIAICPNRGGRVGRAGRRRASVPRRGTAQPAHKVAKVQGARADLRPGPLSARPHVHTRGDAWARGARGARDERAARGGGGLRVRDGRSVTDAGQSQRAACRRGLTNVLVCRMDGWIGGWVHKSQAFQ